MKFCDSDIGRYIWDNNMGYMIAIHTLHMSKEKYYVASTWKNPELPPLEKPLNE